MRKLINESGGEDNVNQAQLSQLKAQIESFDRDIEENNSRKKS